MAGSLPQSGVALTAQGAGQFLSTMRGAEGALNSFQRSTGAMGQIVTGAFRQVGAIITNVLAGAVRAVGGWLKASVGVAGDFEQTLNVLGATSGATGAQLEQVAAKAKALGADLTLPATSAQDAAQVMLELSKAGFSVQESMDAAKGALQLSAAAQVDAAKAAQITAGAINAFNLEASDAVRIADLLAAGANASSASMTDLAQGLQQAGFMFHAVGMPVEDLVTSLAALTNVGLTGSDAGTALKNALIRLSNPTAKAAKLMASLGFSAYDANGKMKPLPELISALQHSLAGMTDEQRNAALGTIFLSDGMKAMIPLLQLGEQGFNDLKSQVTVAGSAADVAGAQMKGWNGAVASARSQMETLQLIIGTVIKNALTPLLFWVADVASKITIFADHFTSAQGGLAKFRSALQGVIAAFKLGSDGTALMGLALGNLRQLIGPFAPLLAGVVTGFIRIKEATGKAFAALQGVRVAFQTGADAAGLMRLSVQNLLMAFGLTQQQAAAVQGVINTITSAMMTFIGQVQAAFAEGGISAALGVFVQKLSGISPTFATIAGAVQAAIPVVQTLIGTFTRMVSESGVTTASVGAAWQTLQQTIAGAVGAILGTIQGTFGVIQTYIPAVMLSIKNATSAELAQLSAFWKAHGTEITAFVSSTWARISSIIQTATQLVLMIVTGVFQSIADFINAHGTEIQLILTGAWQIISNVITAALTLIQGTLAAALQVMQGNWSGAWQTIQQMCAGIVTNLLGIITGFLNTIAGFFGTSLDGIVKLWESNWRALERMGQLITTAVLAFIIGKMDAIAQGIASIIGGAVATWNRLFGEARSTVESVMNAAASIVQEKIGAIIGAFNSIKGVIDSVIGKIKGLIDVLGDIHVPDILTPGSPTPFEVGLWGINRAAAAVAQTFQSQLGPAVSKSMAAVQGAAGIFSGKPTVPNKLPKPGAPRAPEWPGRIPTQDASTTENMYQAIDRLTREAAAKAIAKVATKLPVLQAQHAPITNARALIPPPAALAPQTTTNARTFNMPIYTNQSPAVLAQAFALLEATTA
jgi:TP901 family phage tail tape measure protein